MSEYDIRGRIVKALRPLDAISVENPAYPGTPDVNFIEGWLELKWLPKWPAREDTVVSLEHFTQQQRVWLFRRHRLGGNVWLLLKVERQWMLFTGTQAATVVGKVCRKELEAAAHRIWPNKLDEQELLSVLTLRGK